MTKNEAYNALSEKVQREGGYIAAIKANERLCVILNGDGGHRLATVAALFIGNDDSSPLKLISTRFVAWDVYDYLDAEDIEHLLSRI